MEYAPNWKTRTELRTLRGRTTLRIEHRQYDATMRAFRPATLTPDPILELFVLRQNCLRNPASAVRYGEVMQSVVSPVVLP